MMLQIASGVAFVLVLMAYVYFLDEIYRKQRHEAKIRNGIEGTRKNLHKTGLIFVVAGPMFELIFFQRMIGVYFIPPEYLSPIGTILFACSIILGVHWAGLIYPVKSFQDWLKARWW